MGRFTFPAEPEWAVVPNVTPTAYTRQIIGAEWVHDLAHRGMDGLGECCVGLTFTSKAEPEEIERRFKDAVGRLRFEAPIIATGIVSASGDPLATSWVYATLSSPAALRPWIEESTTVRRGPVDANAFILEMNARRAVYQLSDGRTQYIHWYLLLGEGGKHGVFMHGPHAIIDARPAVRALDAMLEWIAQPPKDAPESLAWGTEYKHLPAGPIAATGGPREDWSTEGVKLLMQSGALVMKSKGTHSFVPQRTSVQNPNRMIRVHDSIDAQTSDKILKALKAGGFSVSHLADAALALSAFDGNPVQEKDRESAYFMLNPSVISQARFLTEPNQGISHFIAGLAMVPVEVPYAQLPPASAGKTRLVEAMKIVKRQYDAYLANPNLPHLLSAQLSMVENIPDDHLHPHASIMTNVGPLEKYARTSFGDVVEVDTFEIGLRLHWTKIMYHIWSTKGVMHIQIQATDAWDEDFLKENLAILRNFMTSIIDT